MEDNMEDKIINAARTVFIEKGYAETSMSEIAAVAGINRPALHYYFRTKDKMYQAVFGSIVSSVVPTVFDALIHKEKSIAERIEIVIDAYYSLFEKNPQLPMFVFRELNRDPELLISTIRGVSVPGTACDIIGSLQEEMEEGRLKSVPLQILFYNFYSLLVFPFLTKNIATIAFGNTEEQFKAMLSDWKWNIVAQMRNLLEVE